MRLDCFLWKRCCHVEKVWICRLNCWAKIRSWELTCHSSTFSILPPAAPHAYLQVDPCPFRFLFIQGSSCGHVEVCPDWYACLSVSRWATHRHSSCLVNHTNQKILWYRYVPRSNLVHSFLHSSQKLVWLLVLMRCPCWVLSFLPSIWKWCITCLILGVASEQRSEWSCWRSGDGINAGSWNQEAGRQNPPASDVWGIMKHPENAAQCPVSNTWLICLSLGLPKKTFFK